MFTLIYPSRWKRKSDGLIVNMREIRTNQQGRYGIEVSSDDDSVSGNAKWSKVQDHKNRLSFSLLHIEADPKRSKLGSLMMFAFAHTCVAYSVEFVNISTANPGERGFYKHLGFHDSRTHTRDFEARMSANAAVAEAYSEVKSYDSGSGTVQVSKKEMLTPLVAKSIDVKVRCEASMNNAWELVI